MSAFLGLIREFKIYDAKVGRTSLINASSCLSIFFCHYLRLCNFLKLAGLLGY